LPISAIVELSDGNLGSASLAASSEWTLISAPDGDSYDGHTAGEYIFHAPLVMPEEEPYFINPDGLQAKVTVLVEEAPPALNWSVLFDGVAVPEDGLVERHYRDSIWITFEVGDWDGDPSDIQVHEIGDEGLLTILNFTSSRLMGGHHIGTTQVEVFLPASDNYATATKIFDIRIDPRPVSLQAVAAQKAFGASDPAQLEIQLPTGDWLPISDELADIIASVTREPGEDVGSYSILIDEYGPKADRYAIDFDENNKAFTITPAAITGITFEDGTFTFDGSEKSLTITGNLPDGTGVNYGNNDQTNA